MGELEDRLKAADSGKRVESPLIKSDLEKALAEADSQDAKDILRAQARRRKAEEELRARDAEHQLRQGGPTMTDEDRIEKEKKLREEISTTAVTLLERGVDPKIVGQYILGSTPVTPITVSGPGMPAAQGLTIDDVQKIMDMATAGKGESELKGVLEGLTAEFRAFRESANRPVDPIAVAKQQAEQIKATYDALKTMGIIKEPVVSIEGKPLLVVQEEHRHDERMEEIKVEREWRQETTKTLSELPERIGRGIASQISEGEAGSSSGGLEYIICTGEINGENCGFRIPITPEAGDTITCGKCGAIFSRKQTGESKTE